MELPFERRWTDYVSEDLAQCLFKATAVGELQETFKETQFVCLATGALYWGVFFDDEQYNLGEDLLPPPSPAAEWPERIRESYGRHCRMVHAAAAQAEASLALLCRDASAMLEFIPPHLHELALHYRVDLRSLTRHFFAATADAQGAAFAEDTYASLLVLIATLERVLSDVMLTLQGGKEGAAVVQPPQILRDLLQHPVLVERLPHGLTALLHYLVGPPIGMNLRNVLWHGFLHHNVPEPYPLRSFLALLVLLFRSVLSLTLREAERGGALVLGPFVNHGGAYAAPLQRKCLRVLDSLADDDGPMWLGQLQVLFKNSLFVLPGRMSSLMRACELLGEAWQAHLAPSCEGLSCTAYGLEKRFVALALLLPQLEHCLRQAFVLSNGLPLQLMSASATVYYTTIEMFLFSEVEKSDKWVRESSEETVQNQLLALLPPKTALLLQELILAANGPRIRDRVAHAVIDPATIPFQVVDSLVVVLCSLAATWTPSSTASLSLPLAQNCVRWMEAWDSLYHPKAILQATLREAGAGIVRFEAVISAMEAEHKAFLTDEGEGPLDEALSEYLSCLRKGTTMFDQEQFLANMVRPYVEYAELAFPLPLEASTEHPELRAVLQEECIFTPVVWPSPCPLPQAVSSVVQTLIQVSCTALQVLALVLDEKHGCQRAAILASAASERMCLSFSKLVTCMDAILLCVRLALVVAEVELLRLGISDFSPRATAVLESAGVTPTGGGSGRPLPRLPRLGLKQLNQVFMGLRKLETRIRRNQWREAVELFCSCLPRELRRMAAD